MKNIILLLLGFSLSNQLLAQSVSVPVPVRDEPHHKVVLENDYVRLINVLIPGHDTTLVHRHAAASVIVYLSDNNIGAQIVGEKPVLSESSPGQINYAAYDLKPINHRVWNRDNTPYHVMDIELVRKPPYGDSCQLITDNSAHLQWRQKEVRTYKLKLGPGNQLHIPESNCAHLLITVTGILTATSNAHMHTMQAGGYVFFPPQSPIDLGSMKDGGDAILLELK
jgi:hypothetical protein